MSSKIVSIDALDAGGSKHSRFVARNPRGDRITLEAHHNAPTEGDPSSIGLGRYRIELEGTRADGIPARYTKIVMRHVGGGEGVTAAQLEKAARLSFEKYCSVAGSLREDIVIVIEASLE